jgi:hypothetical protein
MGKSTPQAPAAPDPYATAAAQSEQNKSAAVAQANLNRIDQYTPQGNITYEQQGSNSDGTPRYKQTQTLSEPEQQKYNQANQIALALGQLGVNNISRVNETQSKPFNYDGMTPMTTSVGGGLPDVKYGPGQGGNVQNSIGDQGEVQNATWGMGGPVQKAAWGMGGPVQKSVGSSDFSADGKRISDSVYGQYTSRLDPQFQQQESDIRSRLAAQGISENSDAYRREMDNFGRTKTDAYGQATYQAQQAGAAEQSRMFGMQLDQGQFANQAVGQDFSQGMQTYQQQNAAAGQDFSQGMQTYDQQNRAQDQKYQQALGMADLFNQANGQRFSQDQSAIGTWNTARGQAFNEQGANATLANQGRQQQISEASYLRNLPLNEIAALLGTGGGVNNPQFQSVAQVGVAAPDYQGLVSNNYNGAMNQYNQQMQARSSALGSVFGALGSLGSAAMLSDRRFKENVRRIGTLASGLATYTFNYIGSKARHFGVMAQEAMFYSPEAVHRAPNGTMYVNYAKVL